MRYLSGGSIRVPEDAADLATFYEWLDRQHTVSVDSETSGLDIYDEKHLCRLIAVGTPAEGWSIPVQPGGPLPAGTPFDLIRRLMGKRLIMQNATYDIQVFARHYGTSIAQLFIEKLWSQTRDTKIIAHQVDPRGRDEGGIGQSLEDLVAHYMPELEKLGGDLKQEFQRLKLAGVVSKATSTADMWTALPIDNEVYLTYAGMDAILTARLFQELRQHVDVNSELTRNDHKDAMIACLMDAKGFLLDVEYTQNLAESLYDQEMDWKEVAASFGLGNINSPQQVCDVLAKHGLVPDQLTPKGNPKVDKVFLNKHRSHPLVEAIIEGKKAGKWRKTWVEKFLSSADAHGRVHPSTNTLRARTARFSITGIPAQTLPSSDHMVRACFVADAGQVIVGVDYAQQELRFAAAKAPDARMIKAFRNGEDLYLKLAEAAFPGKAAEYRKAVKTNMLGKLYGAGARTAADQTGLPIETIMYIQGVQNKEYPGLKLLSDRLQQQAKRDGFITTWTGRKLPVDEGREYAAINYYCQSGCRDITTAGTRRLYDAGYIEHLRLTIHDEILGSFPNDPELIRGVERLMSTRVGPLDMPAEAKVGSRSWGSLYETKE